MEHVNHPAHYQGENGIETIEIIRHYTCDIANALKYLMRAGKKHEMGMDDTEKEIEDLKKALWYIEDFISLDQEGLIGRNAVIRDCKHLEKIPLYDLVLQTTGYSAEQITEGYPEHIQSAMRGLLQVGIIKSGAVVGSGHMCLLCSEATNAIQQRIADIKNNIKN